jgi:tryptophan synthase alpha chain
LSTRLASRFASLKAENRAGLIAYVMAGDPDLDTTFAILKALPAARADVIELGFPFTDPMADGPSIQKAGIRALQSGTTLQKVLALVGRFRAFDSETPLILMGYLNPVLAMGEAQFSKAARDAGADGAIIVDAPPEEDSALRAAMEAESLALIRLATPTTDADRMPKVLAGTRGFLYYVSVTGVTGAKAMVAADAGAAVARLKAATSLPIAVGFGVREPAQAAEIARIADAVVVGSAFVDVIAGEIAAGRGPEAPLAVARKVQDLAAAVRTARLKDSAA